MGYLKRFHFGQFAHREGTYFMTDFFHTGKYTAGMAASI